MEQREHSDDSKKQSHQRKQPDQRGLKAARGELFGKLLLHSSDRR
jgi:hypothetical protein